VTTKNWCHRVKEAHKEHIGSDTIEMIALSETQRQLSCAVLVDSKR
jgi:hypothetical protein